jgi:hypothetical protein
VSCLGAAVLYTTNYHLPLVFAHCDSLTDRSDWDYPAGGVSVNPYLAEQVKLLFPTFTVSF